MMRVLMVTRERAGDQRYGLGKSLAPVLQALQAQGVHCRYLTQADAGAQGLAQLRRWHARVAPWLQKLLRGTDAASLLWGLLERWNMGRLAANVARAQGFTHVHCHDPFIAQGFFLATLFRRGNIRWGVSEHGFGSYTQAMHEDGARLGGHAMRLLRTVERRVLGRAHWVIAPTRSALQQLARDLGLPDVQPHWCAVPHALSRPSVLPERAAARAALGWQADDWVVLAVGRLVPLKRFDVLLEAFARLCDERARLVILGEGDDAPLRRQAEALGVAARVTLSVTDDVWPYYAAADVYVSTSATESFGLANLEAVAAGLPVLAAAAGSVPEVLGAAAQLLPTETQSLRAALPQALAALRNDDLRARRLRVQAAAHAGAMVSAEEIAARLLDAYAGDSAPDAPARANSASAPPAVLPLFAQPAPLALPPAGSTVLVLAPHADDETFGCGGTIARLTDAGVRVVVAIVTDGARGDPENYCGGKVQDVRREEALAAANILGVAQMLFLDFPDGELQADDALAAALLGLLEAVRPVWVFAPDENDAHRDHVAVALAAQRACGQWAARGETVRGLAYEVWSPIAADVFVEISATLTRKQAAVAAYALPLRYVDYRVGIEGLFRYRALSVGQSAAEMFREWVVLKNHFSSQSAGHPDVARVAGGEMSVEASRWYARAVRAEDYAEMAALFVGAFGHEMPEDLWRWKYYTGLGTARFACLRDGTAVAHYGGWSRPVRMAGKMVRALQAVDVLVRSDQRGIHNGPMVISANALFDEEIGENKAHAFGFAFPTLRMERRSLKAGLYQVGSDVLELRWPCRMMHPDWRVQVREMNDWPEPRFDAAANAAWQSMAADFANDALGVRDAQWLRYRYLEHPLNRYHLLAVQNRLGGGVRGIAVLRAREGGEFELLDLIGARRAFPLLVRAARRFAATQGGTTLSGWFARNNSTGLEKMEAVEVSVPNMRQVFAACREPLLSELRRIWWFSSGDMDFR